MTEADQTTADPTSIGAAESDLSLRRKLLSPRTGLSFVVLAAILLLLVTRFDIAWSDTWEAVRTINLGWYAAAVAVHYLTFVFRGARWRLLLANAARGDEAPRPLPSVLGAGRILRGRQSLIGEKSLPDYAAVNVEDRLIHVEESDVDLSHMRNQRQTSNEAAIICV